MQKNRRKITFALMIATFLAAIEGTIVSTATASIANDLQGVSLVSWVFAVYLLTMAVTTPIYGKLADLYGRRLIFTLGTIVFLIGSMLCGLAQSMEQLIFFRALQGLGAGAVIPTTTTIVGDIYPYEMRARVQGLFSAIWGISGVIAPLLGGFLVDYVSWHWIFYINLPFGIFSLILLRLYLKESIDRTQKKQIDYVGAATFTVAVTSFLSAILLGGTYLPWNSLEMVLLFIAAAVFFGVFLFVERQAPAPMLPLGLFRIPTVMYACVTGFLVSTILIGLNIYLPIWIQGVYGFGATGAGLALGPLSIGWVVGANIVGSQLVKFGPRKTILTGVALILIGTFGLTMLTVHTAVWWLVLIMFVMGFGFGYSVTVCVVLGQTGMAHELRGVASAANTFLRSLGQTVGSAIFGAIFNYLLLQNVLGQRKLTETDIEKVLDPQTSGLLPPAELNEIRELLSISVHSLFVIMCVIAIGAIIVSLRFPDRAPEEK